MFLDLVLILITYLVSLILLPFLALIFVRMYGTGWRLFFVVAAIQGAAAFAILVPFLDKFPSAGAIVLPGVLAAAAGIFGVIGLVLYALLFFLIHRPENWKRNSLWLSTLSGLTIAGLVGPSLIARSGITTNVDLHGIVTDIDGQPVPNAEVHFNNCPYIKDPMPVTDAQGRFQLIANCGGLLIIDHIRNRETGTDCQSYFPSEGPHGLIVFNSYGDHDVSGNSPGWANYPAEDPVIISCVWHVPDTVRHHQGGHREFPIDGRTVTFGLDEDGRNLDAIDGEHEGMLHIRFIASTAEPSSPSLPARGRLRISSVGGGIQATERYKPYNAAPTDGYQPYAELLLTGEQDRADGNFFFYSRDRRAYGSVRVWMNLSYDYSEQEYTLPLEMRLDAYVNDAGSRVLLTHKVPYR